MYRHRRLPSELYSRDQTIGFVGSSLPVSVDYDNRALRAELIRRGFDAGPVEDSTRKVHLKKLHELEKEHTRREEEEDVKKPQAMKKELRRRQEDVNTLSSSMQGLAISRQKKMYLSVASSLPASVDYDNRALRADLIRRGFDAGPVEDSTRKVHLKKLHELEKEHRRREEDVEVKKPQALKKEPRRREEDVNTFSSPQGLAISRQKKTYSIEIEDSLRNNNWLNDLTIYMKLESEARANFSDNTKNWREGTAKTSFTYLLLDPRITNNLPVKAGKQDKHASWVTFVNSVFYVGKGKRSRPLAHLYEAQTLWNTGFKTSRDKKVQHILDIWSAKVGVVCLHIFQNVIPAEAYTYEASMIDALGLACLKNLKVGNYYGVVDTWSAKEKRMLGLYLLYKAMLIFLSEGERQLKPDDL